jgi:hypothetical protein
LYDIRPRRWAPGILGSAALAVSGAAHVFDLQSECRLRQPGTNSDDLRTSDRFDMYNGSPQRYELHRVWVVNSVLNPGVSHLYKRRTLYVDQDSWQILSVDVYDSCDQLYRIQEGHAINYCDVPTFWTPLEFLMNLSNGHYLALGLDNEEPRTHLAIRRIAVRAVAAGWRVAAGVRAAWPPVPQRRWWQDGRSSRARVQAPRC